jgi:hypothetical protein
MENGPKYENSDTTFSFTGVVQDIDDGKATWVRIYIDLRNPGNELLAQSFNRNVPMDSDFY